MIIPRMIEDLLKLTVDLAFPRLKVKKEMKKMRYQSISESLEEHEGGGGGG